VQGIPDILLVQYSGVGRGTRIRAYQQTMDQDNAFLKVLGEHTLFILYCIGVLKYDDLLIFDSSRWSVLHPTL